MNKEDEGELLRWLQDKDISEVMDLLMRHGNRYSKKDIEVLPLVLQVCSNNYYVGTPDIGRSGIFFTSLRVRENNDEKFGGFGIIAYLCSTLRNIAFPSKNVIFPYTTPIV